MKFFPIRSFWGKDSSENGLYLSDKTLQFKKATAYSLKDLTVDLHSVTNVNYFFSMKTNWLLAILTAALTPISVHRSTIRNEILFLDKNGNALAQLDWRRFQPEILVDFLQSLLSTLSITQFDETLQKVIQEHSILPLKKRSAALAFKSVRGALLICLLCFGFVIFIVAMNTTPRQKNPSSSTIATPSTPISYSAVSLNDEIIPGVNQFKNSLLSLTKLSHENSTVNAVKAKRDETENMLHTNRQKLENYRSTLSNYQTHKDIIEATITYYDGFDDLIQQRYSDQMIVNMFTPNLPESEYNKSVKMINDFTIESQKLETVYLSAYTAFLQKNNLK